MANPAILMNNIVVKRGARDVLQQLNLSVRSGQVYALLGGNGAGKSTTLFALLGLLPTAQGSIEVNGIKLDADAQAARNEIAYLPETVALYDHLSARENIAYFLSLAGQTRTRQEIEDALGQVHLKPSAWDQRVEAFSKGMRQKAAIALALLRKTPILLLDEPTTGLDPNATADFNALLGHLKARSVTVLMVTHDLLGACDVADTIGLMIDGQIAHTWHAGSALTRFDLTEIHAAVSGKARQSAFSSS
jgi:ABC-2 type transport system ATP-binding protein